MEVIDGHWYMDGVDWDDSSCVHSAEELLGVIERVGFMPLFANGVPGFSVENMTDPSCWWCGDPAVDPWEWRAELARSGRVAYGKFYGGRAGFVSREWFPCFCNYRRDGYDFDARYEDGKAGYREKLLMDLFVPQGVDMWKIDPSSLEEAGCAKSLYTFEMKDRGGFGKGGERGFESVLTKLQMGAYVCVEDFRQRVNKKGEAYGWAVAVMTLPEYLWGYKFVTGCYGEAPTESWRRMAEQVGRFYDADEKAIKRVI